MNSDDAKDALGSGARKVAGAVSGGLSSMKDLVKRGEESMFGEKNPLDPKFRKVRASAVEKRHSMSVVAKSLIAITVVSVVMFITVLPFEDGVWSYPQYMNSILVNVIPMVIAVLFIDTIVSGNNEKRRQREESRAILRHNRIIQPKIDMFLVRKNMVVTPNGKTVRKFQVDAEFSVRDMRDMYGPSELVADVGISKIRRYAYYQKQLSDDFEKLVEDVDFINYPEVAEAATKYINATAYGAAALEAVLGYENARAGTRSMRVMVVSMINDEPDDGRFMDANPTMKNIYLVHQMINDQEAAVSQYLRLVKKLREEDPSERTQFDADIDYE